MFQIPERSGLPSAVLGARADRFGLPSRVRGTPGVGYRSHCAGREMLVESRTRKTEINRAIFASQGEIRGRTSNSPKFCQNIHELNLGELDVRPRISHIYN